MGTTMGSGGVVDGGEPNELSSTRSGTKRQGIGPIGFAGLASVGAGAIHAVAAGIHAEHADLARIFVALAMMQIAAGLFALMRPTTLAAVSVIAVNFAAIDGWLITRMAGIDWIGGLEVREAPQFADTVCAMLALLAVGLGVGAVASNRFSKTTFSMAAVGIIVAGLVVPSMVFGSVHVHEEGDAGHAHGTEVTPAAEAAGHDHPVADDAAATDDAAVDPESVPHDHESTDTSTEADTSTTVVDPESVPHDHDATTETDATTEPTALAWPRAWDPSQPIDVSGVEGVTAEQQLRATKLIEDTLRELPRYADQAAAFADGYTSIGDGGTGTEHLIKTELIEDGALLDAEAPESLVYAVKDGTKTLTGAMYIASARPADDPTLTDWSGPLMTWHKHDNLCWGLNDAGEAIVVGIIDDAGNCARGVRTGGANPMVHVWIEPHPCGVFAALEGIGAGTAAVSESERVDMCRAEHEHGDGTAATDAPAAIAKPYDPDLPIDLSGTPGVTPQQQAAAENLIAVTVVQLPQWSDYKVAEAAGFRSIGDGVTGHEHFIQWDWINDDVALDPNQPESLVYEPQPDGTRKLVSAMYMLPNDVSLDDVPELGGALTQWHIHDNLCFTEDPNAPRVGGVTSPDGPCPDGLQKFDPSPMIHVWITKQKCGPFAALDGVGAGSIKEGEERLCDHAHGAST